jgi:Winged helix DNA-binding domain
VTTPIQNVLDAKLRIARWRLHNQHLSDPAASGPLGVVRRLLAVQAENHSQASWAISTRSVDPDAERFARLYNDGQILRTHVLRPTWHFVLPDDIGWLLDLSRPRITRIWERQLEQEHITQAIWQNAANIITAALTGAHLTRPELAERLAGEGFTCSGHALMLIVGLAEVHGLICSGATRNGEHSYALFTERVPTTRRLDPEAARTELVARYLAGHGPATDRDIAYWATMTLADVRAGIASLHDKIERFDLDGDTFWHTNDPPTSPAAGPRGHLLQILDEYYRGYQHTRNILDIAGLATLTGQATSIGMTIIDSQIVGNMKRTISPERVTFTISLHRQLTDDETTILHDTASRYGRYLNRTPTITMTGPTR